MAKSEDLQRTPLYETHVSLDAQIVPFVGWEMPIQYTGILAETRAVRSSAGIFDVSHMGRVDIRGPGAASFLDSLLSVNIPKIRIGRAKYNLICNESGGIIDDCIVYRREEERFLLIPNASNRPAVLEWIHKWSPGEPEVTIDDVTLNYGMIAYQGPNAVSALSELAQEDLVTMKIFSTKETNIDGIDVFLARTGYTGEDGVEMIVPWDSTARVWQLLMDQGATPTGLGARDVLRLEACLPLHGNDISLSTNPYEADLGRFVDPDREGYVAGASLRKARDEGTERKLVGFTMVERGIPRQGYAIKDGPKQIGEVTSGGHAPTLDMSIGLGYVPNKDYTAVGTRFQIDIRGRSVEAEVAETPFYSRRRSA